MITMMTKTMTMIMIVIKNNNHPVTTKWSKKHYDTIKYMQTQSVKVYVHLKCIYSSNSSQCFLIDEKMGIIKPANCNFRKISRVATRLFRPNKK